MGCSKFDGEERLSPADGELNTDDRKVSQEIIDLLRPFQEEIMRFQSWSPGDIGWIMQSLFRLISHFRAEWNRRCLDLAAELEEPRRPPIGLFNLAAMMTAKLSGSHSQEVTVSLLP
jgi:hypothetical protein